jgi:beta-glucoside operon transcriptional antiterminator
MIVKKILNNNVITSLSESGQEIIIMGNGIGWKQKAGEPVDESKIEKIFRMDTATSTVRLKQLFLEVEVESIRISSEIVDYAKSYLGMELKKNIYITLTDHIDFAIERCKNGINFKTALYWEIRKIYPKEYQVGLYALKLIKEELKIELPEEEAASIALHLVNAEKDHTMASTEATIDIVSTSLNIVRLLLGKEFKEDSLDYQRFVTHLLFFAQRVIERKTLKNGEDFLYDTMKTGYPKAFQCAEKIVKYVERQYGLSIGAEEVTFLSVHIVRIVSSHTEDS